METALTMTAALTEVVGQVGEALTLFTQAPAVYFVAVALFGAAAGVARKFVPMRKR